MEEYKVGEEVLITGLSGFGGGYDHIGKIGTIIECKSCAYSRGAYRIKIPDFRWHLWYLAENITSAKQHKVLTILREYEKRKNTNLSGQESRG